jgi:hypothetical protein
MDVSSPITFGQPARVADSSPGSGNLVIVENDETAPSATGPVAASRSRDARGVSPQFSLVYCSCRMTHVLVFSFFRGDQVDDGSTPGGSRSRVSGRSKVRAYAAMNTSAVHPPAALGRGKKKVATMTTKPRPSSRASDVPDPIVPRPTDPTSSRGHHAPRVAPLPVSGLFPSSGGLKRPPAGVDLGGGVKRVRLSTTASVVGSVVANSSSQGLVVVPFGQRRSPHTPPGSPPPSGGSSRRRRSASRSAERRRSRSRSRGRRRHSRRGRSSSRSRSGRSGRSRAGSPERDVRRRSSSRDRSYTPRDVRDEVSISTLVFFSRRPLDLLIRDYHFYLQETRRMQEERSRAIQRGGGQKKSSERSRRRK